MGSYIEKSYEFQSIPSQHIIQAFELPTFLRRYDTLILNVHHSTENDLLTFGPSHDKRPDLLQFKPGLGVLDPAGLPIKTCTIAGKDADDPLYVPAFCYMSKTLERTDFLFVTDCKGGALENRATIDIDPGFYLGLTQ